MSLGFLGLILLGTALLMLPAASSSGRSIGAEKALFTATSAVCVTGLIVVDTGMSFSIFGQIVLLALIETGGLGFMVFATMVMRMLGRRITLRDRMIIRESINAGTLTGLMRLLLRYTLMTVVIEAAGAAVLAVRFIPAYGFAKGIWWSIWHAVSAFCNAGFDLFGGGVSLTGFAQDPLVLLTVSALIILGSTGFAVISEVLVYRLHWRRFSLHAKLSLISTGVLLLVGTAFVALTEWSNPVTLGGLNGPYRLMNAFFQSVTMRTAGFNSIPLDGLTDGTKLFCVLLMLVGANPASTGGGMKTTTVMVVLTSVGALIRGRAEVTLLRRRVPWHIVRRAVAVVVTVTLMHLSGLLLLTCAEAGRTSFIDLLFEAASAMATVGVSSAGTSRLTGAGKAILIPMMYLGRVGPLTLALALARGGQNHGRLRYPQENVTIG